jgi:hypothetical protein
VTFVTSGFDTECLLVLHYDLGGRSGSYRMVIKFEELLLIAALVVGLITTGWALLAMAALQ